MSDDLRTRIAVIQQAHVFCIIECSCGYVIDSIHPSSPDWKTDAEWDWAEHVADVLIREKDTAIIPLPPREKWGWADGSVAINWDAAPGTPIQLEINPGDVTYVSLDAARELAAGILAAIAEVEGQR